jgi:protein TonB
MLVFLLLVSSAAQGSASAPSKPVPIFEGVEYPREALAHGWEGNVRVDLTISPAGHVTGCRIVQSSGHKVLDDATCDRLMQIPFAPTRDDKGNPVEGHLVTPPITWKLH